MSHADALAIVFWGCLPPPPIEMDSRFPADIELWDLSFYWTNWLDFFFKFKVLTYTLVISKFMSLTWLAFDKTQNSIFPHTFLWKEKINTTYWSRGSELLLNRLTCFIIFFFKLRYPPTPYTLVKLCLWLDWFLKYLKIRVLPSISLIRTIFYRMIRRCGKFTQFKSL